MYVECKFFSSATQKENPQTREGLRDDVPVPMRPGHKTGTFETHQALSVCFLTPRDQSLTSIVKLILI